MKNIYVYGRGVLQNGWVTLPIIHSLLKTYYAKEGRHKFNWVEPVVTDTVDRVFDHIVSEVDELHVLGLSNYAWCDSDCTKLGRLVKKKWPSCVLVAGGPNWAYNSPTFFEDCEFVDVCIPADGEIPFTELLDRLGDNEVIDGIAGTITRTFRSTERPFYKEWGSSLIDDREYLERMIAELSADGSIVDVPYETTRGCPYSCTFCDWGGGIATKVRMKSLDQIHEELDMVFAAGGNIYLSDANFGILKRDLDVTDMLVEFKKKYGWPHHMHYNMAKNNKERTLAIADKLLEHDVIYQYRVSIQDIDDSVKTLIKRTDISLEDHLDNAQTVVRKHGSSIKMDTIVGLPGQTPETFLRMYAKLIELGIPIPYPYPLEILPNAPMASPEQQAEHQFQTITRTSYAYPARLKNEYIDFYRRTDWMKQVFSYAQSDERANVVVESKYFGREDFLTMLFDVHMLMVLDTAGMTKFIARFITTQHGISYFDFYEDLIRNFLTKTDHVELRGIWRKLWNNGLEYVHGDDELFPIEVEVYNKNLDPADTYYLLIASCYLLYSYMVEAEAFYDELEQYLIDKYGFSVANREVIRFNYFMMQRLNIDQWNTEIFNYDWLTWADDKDAIGPERNPCYYHIPYSKSRVHQLQNEMDVTWPKIRKEKGECQEFYDEYMYKVCWGIYDTKFWTNVDRGQ